MNYSRQHIIAAVQVHVEENMNNYIFQDTPGAGSIPTRVFDKLKQRVVNPELLKSVIMPSEAIAQLTQEIAVARGEVPNHTINLPMEDKDGRARYIADREAKIQSIRDGGANGLKVIAAMAVQRMRYNGQKPWLVDNTARGAAATSDLIGAPERGEQGLPTDGATQQTAATPKLIS